MALRAKAEMQGNGSVRWGGNDADRSSWQTAGQIQQRNATSGEVLDQRTDHFSLIWKENPLKINRVILAHDLLDFS
jgi:hypothetical protein